MTPQEKLHYVLSNVVNTYTVTVTAGTPEQHEGETVCVGLLAHDAFEKQAFFALPETTLNTLRYGHLEAVVAREVAKISPIMLNDYYAREHTA